MSKLSYQEKMLKYSNNTVNNLGDMLLLAVLFGVEFSLIGGRGRTSIGARKTFQDFRDFGKWSRKHHKVFKQTYYRLKRQGLIETIKEETVIKPRITKKGLDKLSSTIPKYDDKRYWDGNLYLITYDIEEKHKAIRERLRRHLRKLGCGMMQLSVWITPYNPKEVLKEFVRDSRLEGSVLISDLAGDGSIGSETVPQLVKRVYNLEELNDQYEKFIAKHSTKAHPSSAVYCEFISTLTNDPQLPFELLPVWWRGDEAYKVVKRRCQKILKTL